MPRCRSCGSEVRWVVTLKGKRIPLDPLPDGVRGNVRRVGEGVSVEARAQVLPATEAEAARAAGEPLWLSHFATCPQADTHRSTQPPSVT